MGHPLDGIFLIDKEKGRTSSDVVRKMKAALRGLGVKKVGHAGTLDPPATGLLIALLGQGTKLSPYVMSQRKRYLATVTLGVETDTLDAQGKVLSRRDVPDLSRETLLDLCGRFTGDIEQTPPAFSAVKVDGVRAYNLAREGRDVPLKKRRVHIYALKLAALNLPELVLDVACSSGTYIRSLAADLGKAAGPGAHLKALRRVSIGRFDVRDGVPSSGIGRFDGHMKESVIPLSKAVPDMREFRVDRALASRVRRGRQPSWKDLGADAWAADTAPGRVKLVESGQLVAIARIERDEEGGYGELKLERVFG